jgi:hypothetical protein
MIESVYNLQQLFDMKHKELIRSAELYRVLRKKTSLPKDIHQAPVLYRYSKSKAVCRSCS